MSSAAVASTRQSEPAAARILAKLPSAAFIFVGAIALILFSVTLGKGVQDPDYFWHLTTGRLIATTGTVPTTDPFSFTWAGRPWTTHEWLSELLIYWLTTSVGAVGALLAFAVLAGAIWVIVGASLIRAGLRPIAIGTPCVLGALVMAPYVTLRPQIVSWLLLAGLVWLLLELRPSTRLMWLLPPYFLVWANLHGLWVVGLGVLGMYTLFTITGHTAMASWRGRMLAVAVLALIAVALTPSGPETILYPLRYVDSGDWGLANIEEWQSPNFHEPAHIGLLLLVGALIANGGRGAPGWLHATSIITIAMALVALRNSPVAAVAAVPVLAFGLEERLGGRLMAVPRKPSIALGRRILEGTVALLLVIVAFVIIVPSSLDDGIAENLDKRFPVQGISLLSKVDPDVRLLAEYGWGGYAIAMLYESGGRVFVDGRNDMYDQAILEDYSAVRAADDGWERIVARNEVGALLFPPDVPLVRGPAQDAGWCEVYRDDNEVLLLPRSVSACDD